METRGFFLLQISFFFKWKFFMTKKKQENFIRENILPWQLIRLFCQFTKPPKNKLLLLLGIYSEPFFLMVNSKIHPYIETRAFLKSTQVLLKNSEHYFLAHDSYIDCREVYTTFSLNDVVTQVQSDSQRIRGFVNEETQEQVIAAIKASPVLEKQHKKIVLAELGC
jgi:hypothetical protein